MELFPQASSSGVSATALGLCDVVRGHESELSSVKHGDVFNSVKAKKKKKERDLNGYFSFPINTSKVPFIKESYF